MNSLYGRFGMQDQFSNTEIYTKADFEKIMVNMKPSDVTRIEDIMSIGDEYLALSMFSDDTNTMLNSLKETHNINVGIASAITAYARIYMSQFKNNDAIKLYYTDTDSIFIDLDSSALDKLFPGIIGLHTLEIGELKLEYKINKAIFLGPKAYFLELEDGNFSLKIKGLNKDVLSKAIKKELTFDNFSKLLFKDEFIMVYQDKWYKNLQEGTINILEQTYNIKHNDNKRQLIYTDKGLLIDTVPYSLPI